MEIIFVVFQWIYQFLCDNNSYLLKIVLGFVQKCARIIVMDVFQ